MAMKIRLARGGSKKRPFYRIVAADSRMPRDGRFIEKLGTYNPLLPKYSEERVKMNLERIKHWMDLGAKPTDRVSRMLEAAGVIDKKTRSNPKKGEPHAKTKERIQENADKAAAAKEAAAAPVAEPVVEEAPAEEPVVAEVAIDAPETKSEEAPAAETVVKDAAADAPEAKAEEAPADAAPADEAATEEAQANAAPAEEAATEKAAADKAPDADKKEQAAE